MAELVNRRYVIDGQPRLILAGEIQYFRLNRSEWPERIRQAKEGGLNAISSYIPWIFHEEIEGDPDVTGRKRPERDIGAFIDLCHEQGLWFLARPGPYVMAECQNEGLPYWIFSKYPDAIPLTWGGKKATGKNVDYLHPGFLDSARRWYAAIMPILAKRLDHHGGNVVGVQLDNEIGMLMCWTEEAVLSDAALDDFAAYVQAKYGFPGANRRYGFDMGHPVERAKTIWSGDFPSALAFHADYSEFIRDRFARYIAKLRGFAEENGVKDVPFIINIQGTSDGHAKPYPIGISQTMRCFRQASGYLPSSDQYLGELTRDNICDEYLLNAFTSCVCRPEQPISSIEFQAGTGDYGGDGSNRLTGAAADFKVRLSIAQGNRMISHYTFAAGINPPLEVPVLGGNGRIGTGGVEHDPTSAPIRVGGGLDPIYFTTRETNRTMLAVGHLLADMDAEHDEVHLGFVPDYYTTDVKHAGPMKKLADDLEAARPRIDTIIRPLLDAGFSFPAVNLQEDFDPDVKCIVFSCANSLPTDVQQRLVKFAQHGGNILLLGRLPTTDIEGRPCTLLAEALGVQPGNVMSGSHGYLGLKGVGWANLTPETATWELQPFALTYGEPFLQIVPTGQTCGAVVPFKRGKIAILTCQPPNHPAFWPGLFKALDIQARFTHDYQFGGIVVNRLRDRKAQRFISLINLDQIDKTFTLSERSKKLFEGPITLPGRKAKLLPIGTTIGKVHVLWSTAEVTEVRSNGVLFRQSLVNERAIFQGKVNVGKGGMSTPRGNDTYVDFEPGQASVLVT